MSIHYIFLLLLPYIPHTQTQIHTNTNTHKHARAWFKNIFHMFSFLPSNMFVQSSKQTDGSVKELTNINSLKSLLTLLDDGDAKLIVICWHQSGCPHCVSYFPVFTEVAKDKTNDGTAPNNIVFAHVNIQKVLPAERQSLLNWFQLCTNSSLTSVPRTQFIQPKHGSTKEQRVLAENAYPCTVKMGGLSKDELNEEVHSCLSSINVHGKKGNGLQQQQHYAIHASTTTTKNRSRYNNGKRQKATSRIDTMITSSIPAAINNVAAKQSTSYTSVVVYYNARDSPMQLDVVTILSLIKRSIASGHHKIHLVVVPCNGTYQEHLEHEPPTTRSRINKKEISKTLQNKKKENISDKTSVVNTKHQADVEMHKYIQKTSQELIHVAVVVLSLSNVHIYSNAQAVEILKNYV